MLKLRFIALALVAGHSATAIAQTLTAEQRSACQADFNKYCKGTVPGGGRIIACLDGQHNRLSAACKKVLDAQKK